jgi:hypothetical protein
MSNKTVKLINYTILFLVPLILIFSVRGMPGNPDINELLSDRWEEHGPLELSPERGRFALMYSLVEDRSFQFSVAVARLAIPDLGYHNGQYVSLFAPGVSFLAIPGYLAGKAVNASVLGSFLTISLFALLNFFLIRKISIHLKASETAATFAALIFLFATPAFAYSVSLYQHHVSTFILLLGIYVLLKWNNFWSLGLIWFLWAVSISIDYPNFFLMLPVGLFALTRLITIRKTAEKTHLELNTLLLTSFITVILPLGFFFWTNTASYGNPFSACGHGSECAGLGRARPAS